LLVFLRSNCVYPLPGRIYEIGKYQIRNKEVHIEN